MIRKAEECKKKFNEHMRDGKGTVEITELIASPEELNQKGRLFSRMTLNPGCSIGFHMHEGESELFCMIKGTAEYNDNGEVKTVYPGDVMICPSGTSHGIENCSDEPAEFIALILYSDQKEE
ncbi:MAG: cupin domain-containing protein [Lachnospiraceae bacterium]|nr:cupin domain-containing protein [Lachnospiraceae bacterium]